MHTRFSYFEDVSPVQSTASKKSNATTDSKKSIRQSKFVKAFPRVAVSAITMGMIPMDNRDY